MHTANLLLLLLLIPAFAAINRLRGRSIAGHRFYASILAGIAMALAFLPSVTGSEAAEITVLFFGCFYFYAVWGWGKYFSVIHGTDIGPREVEVRWIDNLIYRLVPYVGPNDFDRNKERGFLGFCFRGLYLTPWFFCASIIAGHPFMWIAAVPITAVMMGTSYFLSPHLYGMEKAVAGAEWTFGAVIGLMTYAVVL